MRPHLINNEHSTNAHCVSDGSPGPSLTPTTNPRHFCDNLHGGPTTIPISQVRRGRHREVTGGCLKTHSWVVLVWMLCQAPLLSLKNLISHHKWKKYDRLDGYTRCGLTLCSDQHSPCPLPLIAGNAQGLPHSRNSRDAAAINPTKQTTQNTRNQTPHKKAELAFRR